MLNTKQVLLYVLLIAAIISGAAIWQYISDHCSTILAKALVAIVFFCFSVVVGILLKELRKET